MIRDLVKIFRNKVVDKSCYFNKEFFFDFNRNIIYLAKNLMRDKFYVFNRFNNNYVISLAINYTRFDIYSNNCEKQLIKWRTDDTNDPIMGIISNKYYNEIKLVD